jgi:hypothetical protein
MASGKTNKSEGKAHKRGSGALGRALGMMAFLPLASRAPIYARLMLALVADERMPAAQGAPRGSRGLSSRRA